MICSIFKRKRRVGGVLVESASYFGQLRMPWDEKTRVFSLNTSDKREADRRLLEERDKAEKRHRGILPSVAEEKASEKPLAELLEAFLVDMRAKGRSPQTVKKYADLGRVLFRRLGWQKLRCVSAAGFSRWLARAKRADGKALGAKTRNDYRANLSRFLHWLQWQGMLAENPLRRVEPVVLERRQFRRSLTDDEAARLLSVAPPKRAAIYLVMMETGYRRAELEALRACDVVLDTPAPFIRIPAEVDKNNSEWENPLRPHVVEAVRLLMPNDPLPFERVFRGLVPRARALRRDLRAAGIPFKDELGRRVDVHALRVTFGSNLQAAGVTPRMTMQLMRHRSMATTMKIYTDAKRLPLAAALAKLPEITMRNRGTHGTQESTQTLRLSVPSGAQVDTAGQTGESLATPRASGI